MYLVIISAFSTIDFIEMLKRTSGKNLSLLKILAHTALKVPFIVQETFIFATFIASIYIFLQLSKKNEYTIIKASGASIWQFLAPFLLTVGVLSIVLLTIINPISSSMLVKQQKIKYKLLSDHNTNPTAIFESGFWLIDNNSSKNTKLIIHSDSINISNKHTKLDNISALYIDDRFHLNKAVTAQYAILKDNYWELYNATENIPKQRPQHFNTHKIPTTITREELQSNFQRPKRISIWELPYFIKTLKSTGHSAKMHIIYFYKLLVKPFIAVALLCIAAPFTLKPFRGIKLARSIISCGIIGFIIYTMAELVYLIGTDSGLSPFTTSMLFLTLISLIAFFTVARSKV
ncbi:MAG: LptF/LptG family permease [Alphaproteobacteria bacterium]|nr:LptF/LptG family permease [Alphaproteobacteria bacterium]